MTRAKAIEALVQDDWEAPGLRVETGIRAGGHGHGKKKTKKKADRKRGKRKKAKRKDKRKG